MDFGLERFVSAQDRAWGDILDELRAGLKTSHWIWFVFPQIAGLGQSSVSRHYSIASLEEARAYLDHPVLGPRLRECAGLMLAAAPRPAEGILGSLDAMKLRSSMTLFLRAAPGDQLFAAVLAAFFDGDPDPATDTLLARAERP